jgi:hypothetical protein
VNRFDRISRIKNSSLLGSALLPSTPGDFDCEDS